MADVTQKTKDGEGLKEFEDGTERDDTRQEAFLRRVQGDLSLRPQAGTTRYHGNKRRTEGHCCSLTGTAGGGFDHTMTPKVPPTLQLITRNTNTALRDP